MARLTGFVASFAAALPTVALLTGLALAEGPEFRFETTVYMGEEEEPASRTVTVFEKAAVYEFVEKPEQIFIYRAAAEGRPAQFILLDPALQRRTDIDVDRIAKLMTKLTTWAGQQKDPALKFAAAPTFDETFDPAKGLLTLASPDWTYRVATHKATNPDALGRYREFIDRYTELTSMLHNSPPPGPRMALNAALAKHGVVPVEIQRITGGDEKNAVRAMHLFSWRLSREDRSRLDEAQAHLANFEKVDNEKFIAARNERNKTIVRGQSR